MITVVTPVVNNVEFIRIQWYCLSKYIKAPFEFIVFNAAKPFPDLTNGGDVSIRQKISDVCEELGIRCIDTDVSHHVQVLDPSTRTADACNAILVYQLANPGKYLLMDSDMFLIDYTDFSEYEDYVAAVVHQFAHYPDRRIQFEHFWNGLCYFDTEKMQNTDLLDWNTAPYADTGGAMRDWLSTVPKYDIYFMRHLWSETWDEDKLPEKYKGNKELVSFLKNDPRNKDRKFFCELYDGKILHYRAGGNWRKEGIEFHRELTEKLKKVLIQGE